MQPYINILVTFNEHFPPIVSFKETNKRFWRFLKSLDNRLFGHDLTRIDPLDQLSCGLRETISEAANAKSLHSKFLKRNIVQNGFNNFDFLLVKNAIL